IVINPPVLAHIFVTLLVTWVTYVTQLETYFLRTHKAFKHTINIEFSYYQGADSDDISSFFLSLLCNARKHINPVYELLITEIQIFR
ncbi:hypothetical protein C0J52_21851, partial [Blattella germanica]